jgi:hypothetical protein
MLLISGGIRFANGFPLALPSSPRSGGEGLGNRLLLSRSAQALLGPNGAPVEQSPLTRREA